MKQNEPKSFQYKGYNVVRVARKWIIFSRGVPVGKRATKTGAKKLIDQKERN